MVVDQYYCIVPTCHGKLDVAYGVSILEMKVKVSHLFYIMLESSELI